MWQHDFIGGCVFLLPLSYTVLTWVSNWDQLSFLKQDFLVSRRWTLKCVKLLKLGGNVPVWEIIRAGSGVKQLELLKLSILCSSWTHYGNQGQINWSLHRSSSLARPAAPIHPICFHIDPVRLVWGRGDAPGPFLVEPGCCLPASQAAGMRLPTEAVRPGRARFQEVLASRPDLRRTISCPEHPCVCLSRTSYLSSSSAAPHGMLYASYESTDSFAPI